LITPIGLSTIGTCRVYGSSDTNQRESTNLEILCQSANTNSNQTPQGKTHY
jgi:hypothetical protein